MEIVKLLTEEERTGIYGSKGFPESEDNNWHATINLLPEGYQTACSVSLTGGVTYEEKEVKRGGITCPHCLSAIEEYKAIKL